MDETPSRLMEKYFHGAYTDVNKGNFVNYFSMGEWDNAEDVIQMVILHFIHTVTPFMFMGLEN